MSQFSRRARWLNDLFPASVLPQSKDPARVTDDVSLVQPYDGSGWGIPEGGDYAQRSPIISTVTVAFHQFFLLESDEVFRLLAADVAWLADTTFSPDLLIFLTSIDKRGTGSQVLMARTFDNFVEIMNPGELEAFQELKPIIGPSCSLRIDTLNLLVGTQFTVGIYGVRAPLGTVFYV